MADLAALTNAFATLTGMTSHAKLLVADQRKASNPTDIGLKKSGPVSPGSSTDYGQGLAGSAISGAAKGASMISDIPVVGASMAPLKLADRLYNNLMVSDKDLSKEYNKSFDVQFNPSSLNISGYSGGSQDITDFSNSEKAVRASSLETNIQLSVNLVFDQMELQKSFPFDVMDFSLTSSTVTVLKSLNATGGAFPISVQSAVEGLVGVLHNPRTRYVCFAWGPMRYKGVLKSVNANYKMFDSAGNPVRAEVALQLYLADKDIIGAGGASNLGMWYNAYSKAFIDPLDTATQMVENAKKFASKFDLA